MDKELTLCIICPTKDAYSETFIQAHIERLPVKMRVLYGGYFPNYLDDGTDLLPYTLPHLLIRAVLRRALKLPEDHFEKAAVRRFLLKSKVDAVLAQYGPTGVAVMGVCREVGIPLITHFHGHDAYEQAVLEQVGKRYPRLFESGAAIIAVSRDMERQLLRLGAPRERLHYNPYGVDISLFQNADPANAPPVLVAVGRFVDKKAPHLTLLAFKKVFETHPEASLIMLGNGPLWEGCKQLSQALGMSDAVDFLGPRPHVEVADTMRQARAFVQHSIRTSYGDSEGMPVGVLEAGATGLPVVATRHAGIQDAIVHGECGFLVDEGDLDGMAKSMIRLVEDPALAGQLGKAARERVCAEFSMEKSIGNLWTIIEASIQKYKKQ